MPSRHAAPRYAYVNADPESHLDDAHRGGTLEEMSARGGTTLPSDAGTQATEKFHERKDNLKIDPVFDHPHADNITDIPRNTEDPGFTGEVVTGTGNPMPIEAEGKRVGESHGGKHTGQTRHTFKSAHAKEMGSSGPGFEGNAGYGKGGAPEYGGKLE